MKQSSKDAIRTALVSLFAELQKSPVPQEGQWVYQRGQNGGWQGSFLERPSTYGLISLHEPLVERLSNNLMPVLVSDYPEYMTKLIGLPGAGAGILQPRMILWTLARESLKRFGGWDLKNEQLESLLEETERFFDRGTVNIQILSPVLNVHGPMEVPPITFGSGMIMRPITDEEVTTLYGGSPLYQAAGRMFSFPDFLFVHELEVPKVFHDPTNNAQPQEPFWKATQDVLDRSMLALSSFKEGGAVGYDGIRIAVAELAFGFFGGQHFWGGDHVPAGHYELTADELSKFESYVRLFENIHPTLEMACQRLVDATRRTKPRDSIVDAIVGLESILLVEIGERQRGETRYRFSLNYASLFPVAERKSAFYRARDLYDLRSKIAHGGEPKAKEKIDGKEITLHEIAAQARAVLRETIGRFLPNSAKPEFLAENYWLTKALGL